MLERNYVDSVVFLSISLINVFKSYRKGRRKIEFEKWAASGREEKHFRKNIPSLSLWWQLFFSKLPFLFFSPLPLSIIRSTEEGTQLILYFPMGIFKQTQTGWKESRNNVWHAFPTLWSFPNAGKMSFRDKRLYKK